MKNCSMMVLEVEYYEQSFFLNERRSHSLGRFSRTTGHKGIQSSLALLIEVI